jgi:putative ABC transport system permease protein
MRERGLREWRSFIQGRADREWRELSPEVIDELACHLADMYAAARESGLSDEEARRRAMEALAAASFLEVSKRPRARRLPTGFRHDIRVAVRQLRATPIVTFVAVMSLALGIGANTAIFSLINSLLLRTLPVTHPEQLVLLKSAGTATSWTNPIWEEIQASGDRFAGATAWAAARFDLSGGGEAQFVEGIWASGRFFEVLGVPVIVGRPLTRDDDRRGGGRDGAVAVIGYGFWQRQFGGAPDVIGRRITVERVTFTIVGVTPPDFFGPDVGRTFDIIVPLGTEPLVAGQATQLDERSSWWLNIVLRLKPDQSLAAAEAALAAMRPHIREATMPAGVSGRVFTEYLSDPLTLSPAATGRSPLRAQYQRPLLTILVVVGLVLLVACANIANLQLARATARRHEVSLRVALGATRWQIARQFLIESIVLGTAGAAAGFLFAQWGSRLIVTQISTSTVPVFLDLTPDWRVLGFTTSLALMTALLFGTVPALRATGVEPIEALNEQGRSGAGARGRIAGGLVIAQVALSLVLVAAAGLFVRSFYRLAHVPLGFDQTGVLIVSATAPRNHFATAQLAGMYERMLEAVRAVPGVTHAALSSKAPAGTGNWTDRAEVPDMPPMPEGERRVRFNSLSSDWFATYRTRILAGRDFDEHDTAGSRRIAIVNQTFVRKFMNGANPIGRTVKVGASYFAKPPVLLEIVGVAADAVYRSLRDPIPPTIYIPNTQREEAFPFSTAYIGVRTTAPDPMLAARAVAAAIAGVDRNVVLTFRSLADQVSTSLVQERLVATLAGFFGALALLLAGLGLFGLTSYAVARRRTEIGIRMALGAAPALVVRLVLVQASSLVAIGIIIGTGISLWASPLVSSLLYQLEPRDPATVAGAAAVLAIVGGVTAWLPAWRASRIDPADVLRNA